MIQRSGSSSGNGAGEPGQWCPGSATTRVARISQATPGVGSRAGRIGTTSRVEDQHRLDGRSHVGSAGGIDTAATCAGPGLEFVPEQPGAELPADGPGDVDGVGGYRLPAAAVAIERDIQAESARGLLRDAVQLG